MWVSLGVQTENLFHSNKITCAEEEGGSLSLSYQRRKPPFHFYADKGMRKIRKKERNDTVLHGRSEMADLRDIHGSTKYHESRSTQLFCHKH